MNWPFVMLLAHAPHTVTSQFFGVIQRLNCLAWVFWVEARCPVSARHLQSHAPCCALILRA